MSQDQNAVRVALVSGGSDRIGAEIVRTLHDAGLSVVIHYFRSESKAGALAKSLNESRPGSAITAQGDLLDWDVYQTLVDTAAGAFGRLDVLINNASTFYPTPIESASASQWKDLMGTNVRAPFFLSKAAAPLLRERRGSIVNLVDIHALRPKGEFPIYSMAKAANAMMVKSLARELGPEVRVNGVAPGAILWPEHEEMTEARKQEILSRTALQRPGNAADIARTVSFLALDAEYITGQIIAVDGGRTIQQ